MGIWTRFWRWFKRNIDTSVTIIVSVVMGTLTAAGLFGPNLNIVLSLILAVLALLALSTIRDREANIHKEERHVKSFEQQRAACRYLIDYVSQYRAREATLLQYSCTTSFDLACFLLDQGTHVTIYVQHEDVPASLGSQGQKERIKQTIRRLQSYIRSNPTKVYHLKLYKYRTLGTVSAIRVDDRVISLGSYTYEQVDPTRDKHYGSDTIAISGDDRMAIVAFGETPEYQSLNTTFNIIEHEYQQNREEVQI